MRGLRIRLFGGFAAERDGKPLPALSKREGRRLLAFLLLRHREDISYRTLAERFWPAEAQTVARNGGDFPSTRQAIFALRRALGPEARCLQSVGKGTVRLDLSALPDDTVDLLAFDRAAASTAPSEWQAALSLYRGPLLEGWTEEWIVPARARRQRDYERLQRQAALAERSPNPPSSPAGRRAPHNLPRQLTSFIGREKEIDQVRGLLAATSLLTLCGAGGCGKTRLSLQAAMDVMEDYPDGVWLVELSSLGDPTLVPETVASVFGLLEQSNAAFPQPNDLESPGIAISTALQERAGKTLMQTLQDYLRSRRLLLMLDNCEHLLDACARLCNDLLHACPRLTVLASSRAALGIAGEQTYRVPPLSLPDPRQQLSLEQMDRYEAVRLFIERARAQEPDFTVTEENAPALVSMCHRLDGIPLAIELAAARVRSLTVEEIHARLDDRFRLLSNGSRNALPRQQTLRSLIDWSYELLSEKERMLFCRLSVFAGGWTLKAAECVCGFDPLPAGDVLDLLTSLVDKSLVLAEAKSGVTRFRLLETVRQYAHDRLSQSSDAIPSRQRQCGFFLNLAEEAEPQMNGPEQARWLRHLQDEHDNLRQAMAFCLEDPDGAEAGLRMASALYPFWSRRGHWAEGRAALTAALARAVGPERSPERARARVCAGLLALILGDSEAANALLRESLLHYREMGDRRGTALCLRGLAAVLRSQGDFEGARTLSQESLAIFREVGDKWGVHECLRDLAIIASNQDDEHTARASYEESLEIAREMGHKEGIAACLLSLAGMDFDQDDHALANARLMESEALFRELESRSGIAHCRAMRGYVLLEQGRYTEARLLLEASLALYREIGDRSRTAFTLRRIGLTAASQGDYAAARAWYEESLAIYRDLGYRPGIAGTLGVLGIVVWDQGDIAATRAVFTESLTLHRELGLKRGILRSLKFLGLVSALEGDYHAARTLLEESLGLAQEIGNPEGIGWTLFDLGRLAFQQCDYDIAQSRIKESLTVAREIGNRFLISWCLDYQGALMLQRGDYESANRLFAEGITICQAIGYRKVLAHILDGQGHLALALADLVTARKRLGESLTLLRELGEKESIADSLDSFASLACQEGQPLHTAVLRAASDALRAQIGSIRYPHDRNRYDPQMTQIRAFLGEATFATAVADGRVLTMEQAIAFALAEGDAAGSGASPAPS